MGSQFARTLQKLRTEKGLSQTQFANQMFVNRSTVARWETGARLPDVAMILRISDILGANSNTLLHLAAESSEIPNVIIVDDSKPILTDGISVLQEALPNAAVTGFTRPSEAVEYANTNWVSLAILDIELGTASGLDLCRRLLEINPRTNVVFLTAYPDYSLDAWNTEASGFMVKPLTPDAVREQLKKLRYPFSLGGGQNEQLD